MSGCTCNGSPVRPQEDAREDEFADARHRAVGGAQVLQPAGRHPPGERPERGTSAASSRGAEQGVLYENGGGVKPCMSPRSRKVRVLPWMSLLGVGDEPGLRCRGEGLGPTRGYLCGEWESSQAYTAGGRGQGLLVDIFVGSGGRVRLTLQGEGSGPTQEYYRGWGGV